MKRIYVIRHGQTDYNLRRVVQGSGIDAPLNETGKQQAAAFHEHFKTVPFDKVYTSALIRTQQSVSAFIEKHPHEIHSELNEISWGVYEGKVISEEDRTFFTQLTDGWKEGLLDTALENGESPKEVAARQQRFVPLIQNRTDEEHILICMHGRAMRIFMCVLLGLRLEEMDRFEHSNLCLYELGMHPNGRFELLRGNYTEHLTQLTPGKI